ncbi:MAG: hypothetical protein AB2L12_10980 [Smithellaceae bacterium]
MVNNIIKVLTIIFTVAFSIACGLLLVRFSIPVYFKLFSPISETLSNFYIVIGVFAFLIILLDIIFLRIGKYNWAILILVSAILLYGFGVPIFMLENNNMLWYEAVFHKPGPVYFIEFSEDSVQLFKLIDNLYFTIWDEVYLYVYAYIIVYLAGYCYLRKQDWRVKGVRLKL